MANQQPSGHTLEKRIEALRANRVSGAVDLALEALDLAADWIASGRPAAELATLLHSMHPAIATVANVAHILEHPKSDLPSQIEETRPSLLDGNRLIAENLQQVIPTGSSVITLSNSSTVREALLLIEPARVYVMQSLPGGEGEGQAQALREGFAGGGGSVCVEVIPDTAIANVVRRVDCALVGIDSYDRGMAILHKVGTLPLALCCRHFGKPFYAAGHSLKLAAHDVQGLLQDEDPSVQMFDCTPGTLIAEIVTEESV